MNVTKDQHDTIRSAFYEYSKVLAQHAMRCVCDSKTAEQLVQDTFVVACEKPETFCTHEKPLAWLFAVLNNKIKQEREDAYRHSHEEYKDELDQRETQPQEPLEYILPRSLDPEERELLILRCEKNWSYEQIAEYKGIRVDACRQKFQRAKKKCGKLLDWPPK